MAANSWPKYQAGHFQCNLIDKWGKSKTAGCDGSIIHLTSTLRDSSGRRLYVKKTQALRSTFIPSSTRDRVIERQAAGISRMSIWYIMLHCGQLHTPLCKLFNYSTANSNHPRDCSGAESSHSSVYVQLNLHVKRVLQYLYADQSAHFYLNDY